MSENKKIITIDGEDFTVRWRSLIDQPNFPGVRSMGYCFTGTINQYRLPHLHKTSEDLQFYAYLCAKAGEKWMANTLGVPEDIEGFLAPWNWGPN